MLAVILSDSTGKAGNNEQLGGALQYNEAGHKTMPHFSASKLLIVLALIAVRLVVCHGHNDVLVRLRPRSETLRLPKDRGLIHPVRHLQQLQSSVASCQPVEYLCENTELVLNAAYAAITAGPCFQDAPGSHVLNRIDN